MGATEAMMEIQGEEYEISPSVWELFEGWWGDKAYREAGMVQMIEKAVRKEVKKGLRKQLEALISDLDYDLHKNLQRSEDDGANHYPRVVKRFAKGLGL
jgi:hypothetical protein